MPIEKIGPFIRRSDCSILLDEIAPVPVFRSVIKGISDGSENSQSKLSAYEITSLDSFLIQDNSAEIARVNDCYKKMSGTANLLLKAGVNDLGKILSALPCTLLLDADSLILPVLSYLKEVGIDQEDIPHVLESFPTLLVTSVAQMSNVIEYLFSLGVSEDIIGSIIRAFPALLTLDVENKMVPVVEFLSSIGVTNIGRFVT